MKIGSKLKLGFGAMILFTVGVAGTGVYEFKNITKMLEKDLSVAVEKLQYSKNLEKEAVAGGFTVIASLKVTDEYDINRFKGFLDAANIETNNLESKIEKIIDVKDNEELFLFNDLKESRAIFDESFNNAIRNREKWGKEETNKYFHSTIMKNWESYQIKLRDFSAHYDNVISKNQEKIISAGQNSTTVMLILLAAIALLGVVLSFKITSSIVNNLGRAVVLSRNMAEGKFNNHLKGKAFPDDETGDVLSAMATMEENIRQIIMSINGNSHNLISLSDNLNERNLQLSARTEQQSASIEETAATIEELGSTISHTAENSKNVAKLSQEISHKAEDGVKMVKNVVEKMSAIKGDSEKISQITAMIDTIAFQTNILALNAAVEAARAGEQGRGFAVVASEVRVLSQKSAQAAKDIKALIDASSKQVVEGNALANEVEDKIVQMVNGFKKVNVLISEITSSNSEQSNVVKQIQEAISQIDTVTQQNAALVEQSARAAEHLVSQSHNLESSVARFHLN